jgi:hypothetical protein
MSDPLFHPVELPLDAESEIDGICDRFDARWRAGARPQLEDFWTLTGEPARTELLRELLRVEVEYRQRAGETGTLEQYQARFPGFEEAIRAVLESGLASAGHSTSSLDGGNTSRPTVSWVPAAPVEATVVPGYEILGELGRGGMGVVYKARHLRLDRLVALKLIRGAGSLDPEAVRRFEAEARTVARFDHPNIVRVHDSGEQEGVPWLALEFVAGGNLARQLHSGPWPARKAAELVARLADAVDYAHRQQVIHRDLKPANVLVTEDGTPKVADFGLARLLDQAGGATVSGSPLGTPRYMSPEQAGGRHESIGPATDVFGLGAILYELLTGRPPLEGTTTDQILNNARQARVVPPRALNPRVPRALERICLRALSLDPARRQGSASELGRELRRFLGRGWGVRLAALAALVVPLVWWLGSIGIVPSNPTRPASQSEPARVRWHGFIDITVTEPGHRQRRGLRLWDPAARPLRTGDLVSIEAEVSRPAYLYILWIDTEGKVGPVYPWVEGDWQRRRPEGPRDRLTLPEEKEDGVWKIDPGPPGMETLVLLARETPLPPAEDLLARLGRLEPQPMLDELDVAWFENGALRPEKTRGANGPRIRAANLKVVEESRNPTLRTQRRVQQRLGDLFDYTAAVTFANRGGKR